jgi:hypothetical protein
MNKQLTKNTIGIAASAALIATMAFSGSALAGPGDGKGPQSSAGVFSVCHIDADAGELVVDITITDKSSGIATASLDSASVQGLKKVSKNLWMTSDDKWESAMGDTCEGGAPIMIGTTCTVRLDICSDLGNAKAVNAETTVTLQGTASKDTYLSRCKDDPATDDINEAKLKVADYPGLCQ